MHNIRFRALAASSQTASPLPPVDLEVILPSLTPEHRAVLLQLTRFVISGGAVTALGIGVYAFVAIWLRWHPQLGNLLAYVTAALIGYWLHSHWSFKGHGKRGNIGRTGSRFVAVSLISLGLNSLWVWLATGPLDLGPVWPILPMLLITPLVTFALNRQWVFT